jgi:hypothetical protein
MVHSMSISQTPHISLSGEWLLSSKLNVTL